MINLYKHQEEALKQTEHLNKVAYYLDMGLGKTFVGSEKMISLGANVNLVVCQKSKIDDWFEHFDKYYDALVLNLTNKTALQCFLEWSSKWIEFEKPLVGVINYDLIYRRKELLNLKDFTLMLDESSLIQNDKTQRTKYILKLKPANVILLSGTPVGGKYENLWSQAHLLGWDIGKTLYYNHYVDYDLIKRYGKIFRQVNGYKNVERLKAKLREYGAVFMKTEDVYNLPTQTFTTLSVSNTSQYKRFKRNRYINLNGYELVGDNSLKKLLYERQLCGQYNPNKIEALKDLLESSNDRFIIFYSFNEELRAIEDLCLSLNKPLSIVNGYTKDLSIYEEYENSVTAIQYQAGAMGLNLQKANKMIYFTPTLSSELFEQSKKRTHRLGQDRPCYYYMLVVKDSIEEHIYEVLEQRKDFTNELYQKRYE